jgi:hypothetical protein
MWQAMDHHGVYYRPQSMENLPIYSQNLLKYKYIHSAIKVYQNIRKIISKQEIHGKHGGKAQCSQVHRDVKTV